MQLVSLMLFEVCSAAMLHEFTTRRAEGATT
jgi:hypothetical protein